MPKTNLDRSTHAPASRARRLVAEAARTIDERLRQGLWLSAVLGLWLGAGCGKPSADVTLPKPTENPPASYVAGTTWYKDVQPIVRARCEGCHTGGGIAPFALTSYDLVKQYAPAVSSAVEARRMPPWMPDPACQSFTGSRRLEQSEVDTVVSWVQDGSPLGDPRDQKPPPPAQQGLAQPSATVDIGGSYTPAGLDDYRCFLANPALAQDRDLIAYEFVPGHRPEVHHVLIYSATAAAANAADAADPGVGWGCGGGPGVAVDSLVAGWVPGTAATYFPSGTGIPIGAGRVLVIQIHYNTANGAQPDRSSLKLLYSEQPVPRRALLTPLSNHGFAIPPGAQGYAAVAAMPALKSAVTLWGLAPHMHTMGRSALIETDSQCQLYIPRWDFNWQQFYFTDSPTGIQLPAGTRPKFTCVWDNPTDRTVRWGEGTTDEMCIAYFYVTSP